MNKQNILFTWLRWQFLVSQRHRYPFYLSFILLIINSPRLIHVCTLIAIRTLKTIHRMIASFNFGLDTSICMLTYVLSGLGGHTYYFFPEHIVLWCRSMLEASDRCGSNEKTAIFVFSKFSKNETRILHLKKWFDWNLFNSFWQPCTCTNGIIWPWENPKLVAFLHEGVVKPLNRRNILDTVVLTSTSPKARDSELKLDQMHEL